MTIDEYEKIAYEDLNFDVTIFKEYCSTLALKRIKWARFLYQEETISSEADERLKELYKNRLKFYQYDYEYSIDKKYLDIYIRGDKIFQEAEKIYSSQKSKESFVREIVATIDRQSYQMNNVLKHLLWESGVSA